MLSIPNGVESMQITVHLTPTDLSRLEQIRKLYEAAGRPWRGIEATAASLVSVGIHDELRSKLAYKEAQERGPYVMGMAC